MYNHLDNPHHVDLLSCGPRHIASVDICGVWSFLPFEADYYGKITSKSPVVELIINHIKGLDRTWYGTKRKSVVLGNYRFTFNTSKDEGEHLTIKPLKDASIFNCSNWCSNDVRFTAWFTQHYDFAGLGELQDSIYALMMARYTKIMNLCKKHFHTQTTPEVDRRHFNPEVCCRQLTFAYWAALTMRNAIGQQSFVDLPRHPRRNNVECVHTFEEIVNDFNGTDLHYAKLYYNDESLKKDQKHAYEMCKAILGRK